METVEQFIARALHHPKHGYYARNIRTIGSRGDFTTAPQLSEAPAKAIATWAAKAMRKHRTQNLIEIGPGLGTLASQVLKKLPPLSRLRTKLHLVESSPTLSTHQKKNLPNKVTLHTTIHQALEACSGNAIIYSNELVDAFPARIFQKTQLGWQEIALKKEDLHLTEILLPIEKLPDSSIFSEQYKIGQRIEVHESYHQWLTSWLPQWEKGEILTIDYGDTSDNLYTRKPRGSLRAYFHHHLIEGLAVFENPGHQDITTDVNFTDISNWALLWLKPSPTEKLYKFIQPHIKNKDHQLHAASNHFSYLIQTTRN